MSTAKIIKLTKRKNFSLLLQMEATVYQTRSKQKVTPEEFRQVLESECKNASPARIRELCAKLPYQYEIINQ